MSGSLTPVGAQYALDYVCGTMDTTLIGGATARSVYLMLLTATPSNTSNMSTFTEVSATGYARQSVSWSAAALNGAGIYQLSNTSAILFGPFTGVAGLGPSATMCALVTVSTGTAGVPLMLWTLDSPGTAAQNSSLQFAIGTLTLTLA